jgi:hypothetical protein
MHGIIFILSKFCTWIHGQSYNFDLVVAYVICMLVRNNKNNNNIFTKKSSGICFRGAMSL